MTITINKTNLLTLVGILGGLIQYLSTLGFTVPTTKAELGQAAFSVAIATIGYLAKGHDVTPAVAAPITPATLEPLLNFIKSAQEAKQQP